MKAVPPYIFIQLSGELRTKFFGYDGKMQRKHLCRDRRKSEPAVCGEIFPAKARKMPLICLLVPRRSDVAQNTRSVRHNLKAHCIKDICDIPNICPAAAAVAEIPLAVQRKPIAVLMSVCNKSVFEMSLSGAQITLHRLEIIRKEGNITVHFV